MTRVVNIVGVAWLAAVSAAFLLIAPPADATDPQQDLVDRARLVVEALKRDPDADQVRRYVQDAHAIVVIPAYVKAGLIIGGAVGEGVIVGRDPQTSAITQPAFVELTEGSIGLQAGVQTSEIILTVLSQKGLEALLSDKFTIGGDAGLSVFTIGAQREAATTTNINADIVAFGRSKGLFGGVAIDGTVFTLRDDANAAYYGEPLTAKEIVVHGRGVSVGTANLREQLRRF